MRVCGKLVSVPGKCALQSGKMDARDECGISLVREHCGFICIFDCGLERRVDTNVVGAPRESSGR